jgi:hypothetical protein
MTLSRLVSTLNESVSQSVNSAFFHSDTPQRLTLPVSPQIGEVSRYIIRSCLLIHLIYLPCIISFTARPSFLPAYILHPASCIRWSFMADTHAHAAIDR